MSTHGNIVKGEGKYQAAAVIIVGVLALISFYPIYYVVSLSLVSEAELISKNGMVVFPSAPTLRAYRQIFINNPMMMQSFWVSVLRTVVGSFINLTFTLVTGYIVSRKNMPFKSGLLVFILITILFNGGLIPTYIIVRETGLYNSFWAYIIPGLVDSWSVLIFKQFFGNIPAEIEESADMDGVTEISKMLRVVIPMSIPVIAALGLFSAVGHWNAWFDSALYIRDQGLQTFQLLLKRMFENTNMGYEWNSTANTTDLSMRSTALSLRMAVAVIGTVPILCIYPFLQKHFTKGVYVGAVKG